MVDGAPVMALFAYLGDFKLCFVAHCQPGAQIQLPNLDPSGGDIFGKISGAYVYTLVANLADALHGEKAYLAMPVTSMGIARKPFVFY
jgi:hypothetical protein